jgi:hypothetical protein
MTVKEIARFYKIPVERAFGNTGGYILEDVRRTKADATRRAKALRGDGRFLARVVRVVKPHGSLKNLPYKASDYHEYAIYFRPRAGWNPAANPAGQRKADRLNLGR